MFLRRQLKSAKCYKPKLILLNRLNSILAGICIILATGCATTTKFPKPPAEEIRREREKQLKLTNQNRAIFEDREARLHNVSAKIFRENAEFCPRKMSVIGINWKGNIRTVSAVEEGTPAHLGGLMPYDKILSINGKRLRPDNPYFSHLSNLLRRKSKNGTRDVTLQILRYGKEELDITLRPADACKVGISLIEGDNTPNAFTDGQSIGLTEGMIKFVDNDDELALIIGHELAHITQKHVFKKEMNTALAGAVGAAVDAVLYKATGVYTTAGQEAGLKAGYLLFSQDFELESDYVGTYFAARAGYDVSNAVNVWRRMAAIHPTAIHARHDSTHPSTAARFVGIEHAFEEVLKKQRAGVNLIPEKK